MWLQIVQATTQVRVMLLAPASVVAQMPALELSQNVWLMIRAKVIQHIKEFSYFKKSTLKCPF